MQIGQILRNATTLAKHNTPAILTGAAVVGTITTAVLAGRASWKAADIIAQYNRTFDDPIKGRPHLTNKEKVKIVWPLFIPAVGVGALTVSCVLGANHLHGRQAAALAGAYSLSEKAFSEYRDKVAETLSATKEQKVRDAVAQDTVTNNPPAEGLREIMLMADTDILCYESMTGRYFSTNVEALNKAVNDFNRVLLQDMHASLNDYWDRIGLPHTTVGDELGFTSDKLLEIHITTTLDPKGKPCLCLGYITTPIPNYWKSFR